jgi:hypothetical protein
VTELTGEFAHMATYSTNVTVVLSEDGCYVTLETEGKPDHVSAYWDPDGGSGLHVDEDGIDPSGETDSQASPGYIDDVAVSHYSLTVPVAAEQATETTATSLGATGIAVSGAPIFNDDEGNGELTAGVAAGLDADGAHTGPEVYHYHLEPTRSISNDDDQLIGIINDGFFLYGRKCYATADYPTDLDDTNGHTSVTLYSTEEKYHYHVVNEYFLDEYYLLFPDDLRGTANAISN